MRAYDILEHGGIEVLREQEAPEPQLDDRNNVLVRMAWTGLNFVDIYQREGRYPGLSLPWRLGIEGAGVVEQTIDASGFVVGDRVAMAARVQGTYAQKIAVSADKLVRVPDGVTLDVASAVLEHGLTAQMVVETVGRITSGDRVLIHAAAGGVGAIACQWALSLGAQVWGTCSTVEKADDLKALGVRPILYGKLAERSWAEAFLSDTGEMGATVVLDSVGADTVKDSLAVLGHHGHLVLFGAASGFVDSISVPTLMAKSLSVTRPVLPHFIAESVTMQTKAEDLFRKIQNGDLTFRIHDRLAWEDAPAGHAKLQSRLTRGKLLLRISGER